jgi:hypothetical protein
MCGGTERLCDGSCSLSDAGELSGPRLERGLPSAQLLSVVDLVLAGRNQGGVPRPGQHPVGIRRGGALSELRDAAALGGVAEKLRQADPLSRLHPVQRVPARPLHLPILRPTRGPHLRPCRAPFEGRDHDLAERGRRLLGLQPQEGRHAAGQGAHVAGDQALPADRPRPPPERAPVPAELFARKLDGLSLLGQRTGGIGQRSFGC